MSALSLSTRTTSFSMAGEIIRCEFLPGAVVCIADAQEHVRLLTGFCQGTKVPVYVDLRHIHSQDRGTRAIYAGEQSAVFTKACALMVSSPVSKVLGSFFLGFNKPIYPTRLFTSEGEAMRWLSTFTAAQQPAAT